MYIEAGDVVQLFQVLDRLAGRHIDEVSNGTRAFHWIDARDPFGKKIRLQIKVTRLSDAYCDATRAAMSLDDSEGLAERERLFMSEE